MQQITKISFIFFTALILSLSGCGGGDGDSSTPTNPTPTTQTAYFIDSAVEGVSYTTTQEESGITDSEGKFTYTQGATVTFKIGGVEIGTISNINSDKKVFIQDIVGVERTATDHSEVLKIAQFLQSIDSDNDPTNGIKIEATTRTTLANENKILTNTDIAQVETIVTNTLQKTFKTSQTAQLHLNSVVESIGLTPSNPMANIPTCEENEKLVGSVCVEKTCVADGYNCPEPNIPTCEENKKLVGSVCVAKTCIADGYNCPQEVIKTGNVEDKYYGKWIYAEGGDVLNIDTTTKLTYTASNDNLLVVTEQDGTKKSYLRASASKVHLKGQLTQRTSTSRALRDYATIGDIDVILQNILDPNIKATITTDENGYFEDNTLPAGTYQIEATTENPTASETKEINTTITISDKVEDLGEFVLLDKDEHNFKAELLLNHGFVIADDTIHTATIRVNNISSKKAVGVWFDIKIKDALTDTQYQAADINYTDSTMSDDSIGTIFSKSYKDIDVSFTFDPIYKNNKDTIIELTIHDADNNTWTEELKFVLYKGTFDINVDTSKSNVKGYIRLPYNEQILAIDMTKGSITLPLLSEDKHYPLVLANSNELDGETKYSIGINSATLDFSDFKNTGAYEDDDNEEQATQIGLDDSVISYIHYGDLDYWKIVTEESNTLMHFTEGNFYNKTNALLGETVVSNEITITSIAQGHTKTATVTNGTIVLNGVDTNSISTNVTYGDKIAVKLISSGSLNTTISTVLTLDTITRGYSTKTITEYTESEFTPKTGALLGETVISNEITITSIAQGYTKTASVDNNAVIIKNGVEEGNNTVVTYGDKIAVKLISSGSLNTTISTVLTLGTITREYSTKTITEYTENDFTPKTGALLGETVVSNEIIITSIAQGYTKTASVTNGTIVLNGVDTHSTSANVTYGDKIAINIIASKEFNKEIESKFTFLENKYFRITTKMSEYNNFPSKSNLIINNMHISSEIEIIDITTEIIIKSQNASIIKNGVSMGDSTTVRNGDKVALEVSLNSELVYSELEIGGKVLNFVTSSTNFLIDDNSNTILKIGIKDKGYYLDNKCSSLNINQKIWSIAQPEILDIFNNKFDEDIEQYYYLYTKSTYTVRVYDAHYKKYRDEDISQYYNVACVTKK